MEISLSYLYCKTHEDRDHPFSVFLSTLALSLILVPYRKHSSFFIWGFARVVVMVFLSLSLSFFFFLTLIQIIRQGWGWTGRKRRVNFALFCAKRGKHLTTDFFFYKYKVKEKPQAHYCNTNLWSGLPQWLSSRVLPALQEMQEKQVQSLGPEYPLEEELATHSSILVWEISRTEEPGGLQSVGSERVEED